MNGGPQDAEALLVAEDLVAGYGEMTILNGCSLSCGSDEIAVIVGPNGAGKSTAMKAIFGLLTVREGSIRFKGEEIRNMEPQTLVPRGMAYVPQERNIFPTLSVEENLEMGAYTRRDDFRGTLASIYDLFPILKEKRRQPAGQLSGGQRQMVAIGRALMVEPQLLMLDEPTAGLSPLVMDEIFDRIQAVNRTGVGILMVEQNARQALAIATTGYVLATGRNRFTGTGAELLADPDVAKSFLGG